MMETGHQQLASLMQEQLQALGTNLTAENNLSEQVMDLREVKATLSERLQATDSALRDARREVVALKQKDEDQLRTIIKLEADIAKACQPTDDPVTLRRLQEIDSQNKGLRNEIVSLRTDSVSLSTQLQQKTNDIEGLNRRLSDMQAKLQEAQHEVEVVREEKLQSEKDSLRRSDDMRLELLEAASLELANVKSEHINAIEQMNARKSPMDNKLSHATKQYIVLQAEKEMIEQDASQLKLSLKGLQKERQNEVRLFWSID